MKTPVLLDFLDANEIVAALEFRRQSLLAHVEQGVTDDALDVALMHNLVAEERIRAAFHIQTEAELDALHEALSADIADLAHADVPMALDVYWNRGA